MKSWQAHGAVLLVAGFPFASQVSAATVDLAVEPADLTFLGTPRVIAAGDLNGDRIDDLVLDLHYSSAAIQFGGSPQALPALIDLRTAAPDVRLVMQDTPFDSRVADVSGDGIGDLILIFHQEIQIVNGRRSWPPSLDLQVEPPDITIVNLMTYWNQPSADTADFNRDGLLDLVIGAPGFQCSGFPEGSIPGGAAFVFWTRDASGRLPRRIENPEAVADSAFCAPCTDFGLFGLECPNLGQAVATGDLDHDGLPDLAIGAPFSQQTHAFHAGLVHTFLAAKGRPFPRRSDVRILGGPQRRIEGAGAEFHLSRRLGVGDFNQDGIADLFLTSDSAWLNVTAETRDNAGEVRVVLGGPSWRKTPYVQRFRFEPAAWNGFGAHEQDYSGNSFSIGDVSGDGFPDLLVGAVGAARPGPGPDIYNAGKAYLIMGRPFTSAESPIYLDLAGEEADLTILGSRGAEASYLNGDRLGNSVALGDYDGDGRDDPIVSALYGGDPSNPQGSSGAVYVFLSTLRRIP